MGTIITFSTYQPRGENYIKWASFVAMVNLATSLLSSFVIFLVMGFWTTTSGTMCIKRWVILSGSQGGRGPTDLPSKPLDGTRLTLSQS